MSNNINNNINSRLVITIDGPSGVGKGTLSQFLSEHLGWSFLDSGALYRIVAYYADDLGLDYDKPEVIASHIDKLDIKFLTTPRHPKWGVRVMLNNKDVTDFIRSESSGKRASMIAQKQEVRSALLDLQKQFGSPNNLVADGRDMGSVVFKNSPLKLYLTASNEVRAERRYQQLCAANINAKMSAILSDLNARDERDKNRSVSPLKPADDAIIIDTSGLSVTQVQQRVLELVNERISPLL